MSSSDVTKQGLEGVKPDIEAVTGAEGRGTRPPGPARRGPGEQRMVPGAAFQSYYGKPVLNQPVWHHTIPAYFFTGGLAAGSSLLAAGAGSKGNAALRRQGRYTALGAVVLSTGFLIEDLGKPTRFHHMLRMFKPTSPMSVGSWVLAGYGPLAGAAAVSEYLNVLPRLGRAAELGAAVLSPLLGTYTAAIFADTAITVWHEDRHLLPFAFAGSAMAAAGGMAMATVPVAAARPARRLAVIGAALETVVGRLSRRRLGEAFEAYDGTPGVIRSVSEACSAAGLLATVVAGRRRWGATAAGVALLAGSLAERLAVFEAGRADARDPKFTVRPQRRRLEREGHARAVEPRITEAVDHQRPTSGE